MRQRRQMRRLPPMGRRNPQQRVSRSRTGQGLDVARSTSAGTRQIMSEFTTVPLRCPACGQQTHKTLESVVQEGGFLCECGARNELDIERFAEEIRKSEAAIKDFGRRR
jgi:hypothetical protein